jgi:hypothetical protein
MLNRKPFCQNLSQIKIIGSEGRQKTKKDFECRAAILTINELKKRPGHG